MCYEGSFENNKPKGEGKWMFKCGNVLTGAYTQKAAEVADDDGGEGEEGGAKKAAITLDW